MDSHDKIADALGVEYLPAIIEEEPKEIVEPTTEISSKESDRIEDYNTTRKTYQNMLQKGNEAVDQMSVIADESKTARSYEILALLLKTTSEMARDFYNIHKITKEIQGGPQRQVDTITVDKAVFVGTTDQLLQEVKKDEERN